MSLRSRSLGDPKSINEENDFSIQDSNSGTPSSPRRNRQTISFFSSPTPKPKKQPPTPASSSSSSSSSSTTSHPKPLSCLVESVWKRRDGLGHNLRKILSPETSWERRRLVLSNEGTLMYFSEPTSDDDDEQQQQQQQQQRGEMNLLDDLNDVTVSSSNHFKDYPSPYSIKVTAYHVSANRAEPLSRWKICFDTEGSWRTWLCSLQDLLLAKKVAMFGRSRKRKLVAAPMAAPSNSIDLDISSDNDNDDNDNDDNDDNDYVDNDNENVVASVRQGLPPPPSQLLSTPLYTIPVAISLLVINLIAVSVLDASGYAIQLFHCLLLGYAFVKVLLLLGQQPLQKPQPQPQPQPQRQRLRQLQLQPQPQPQPQPQQPPHPPPTPTAGKSNLANTTFQMSEGNFRLFKLRDTNYKQRKLKRTCPTSLYKCVAIDILKSKKRIDNIGSKVNFNKLGVNNTTRTCTTLPQLFIVNIQLPSESPSIIHKMDGEGYNLVCYFELKQETIDVIEKKVVDKDVAPAAKLLER